MNEAQVIALVRAGNTDAFAEIVEQYQIPIIRYLYRLTGDNAVAQDLAQDTFANAYQAILKTDSELSFKAWLYKIATNNARQYHRRNRLLSFVRFTTLGRDNLSSQEDLSDSVEQKITVEEALLKVPHNLRQCMVLHFVEGLKYREIGEVLGVSENAVRKRIARGREVFQREYRLLMGGEA